MSDSESYTPGPASAELRKGGDTWTLVLVRDLRHPPAKVWKALTDPAQLREWAPFDADRDLGSLGTAKLSTVGAPYVSETRVKRADPHKALEYDWGGGEIRWELEPWGESGTRLTLWANINRTYVAMGAAGWHVCLDVLDRHLTGRPVGRIAGPAAMKFEGWQRLNAEYSKQFGIEVPAPGSGRRA
jgi:uncharacterized protein YndB with AHSA1/START domain